MRIGEVAHATGVPVKTLRYWEQAGVLEPPSRLPSGYRDYSNGTINQVQFILSAQALGLPLRVIGGILSLRAEGVTPCEHVEELLRNRLEEIDRRIQTLKVARTQVAALLNRARELDPGECDEKSVCHLISP